jgi:hypothetical protein
LPWQLPAIGDERRPETACFCTRLGPEIDEDWQETVDELTARAGVVLPQAGESAGLAWEVRHVLRRDAPERVSLEASKHGSDQRPETYRPNVNSLEVGEVLDTKRRWSKRREYVEPLLIESMCEALRRQQATGHSLAAFRPGEVLDLLVDQETIRARARVLLSAGRRR